MWGRRPWRSGQPLLSSQPARCCDGKWHCDCVWGSTMLRWGCHFCLVWLPLSRCYTEELNWGRKGQKPVVICSLLSQITCPLGVEWKQTGPAWLPSGDDPGAGREECKRVERGAEKRCLGERCKLRDRMTGSEKEREWMEVKGRESGRRLHCDGAGKGTCEGQAERRCGWLWLESEENLS